MKGSFLPQMNEMEVCFMGNKYNTETIQYFLETFLYQTQASASTHMKSSHDYENDVDLATVTDDELSDSEGKIAKLNFI